MRNKGFTLIELIISIALITIIIMICSNVFASNIKIYRKIGDKLDRRVNTRIAMDFITDKLRGSKKAIIGSGIITVDAGDIYLKNNILRFNTDSQQIANNITTFCVERKNDVDVFELTIGSEGADGCGGTEEYSMSTFISQ